MKQRLFFLRTYLSDRSTIGAVTPTSQYAIKKVCKDIDFSKPLTIVEYGPGTGVFARYLLEKITSNSKLILIETNPRFVSALKRSFSDSRVTDEEDRAENVEYVLRAHGIAQANFIISGIPFSQLPKALSEKILHATRSVLTDSGAFLVYQYRPKVHAFLKPHFPSIKRELACWNIPPALIYKARK